ncbi:MAG: hypothetical protein IKY64_02230 [Bacteroidaceae bacterium]|nr:hypothetical protein [Bacteroidaceae bacterium]
MIKRRLLPLMCVVASLMSLTSCFPDLGYSQSADFARVVTINRKANPLQLDADYTGEVFKLDNLTSPEQLSLYNLEGADRAIAYIHFEVDRDYKESLTLTDATEVKVNPVWNKALPDSTNINPLTDLYRLQFEANWLYPYVWMAGKYLNVVPVIRSLGRGQYYLKPTAVYGDTLRFDMTSVYTPSANNSDVVDFINFDLSTLADTTDADAVTSAAVRTMLNTIDKNDSVCVMLVGEYRTKGYLGTDTIVKWPAYTNYTKVLKNVLR